MARKYRNKPVTIDGIRFDSKGEAARWAELRLLEHAGEISDLQRQAPLKCIINGKKVCTLRIDFAYRDEATGGWVYEDFKGVITKDWALKRKVWEALNPDLPITVTGAE